MDIRRTAEAKPPAEAVIRAASLLKPGRALDIACGAGRHAIWLHRHGWEVTAVDRDIDVIAQLGRDYPAIGARVVDLEENPFPIEPAAFNLVVCWLYHQSDLYPRIREAVRPGGIAAISGLIQGRFAADPVEVRNCFAGWIILHEAQTDRTTELVVQRP